MPLDAWLAAIIEQNIEAAQALARRLHTTAR